MVKKFGKSWVLLICQVDLVTLMTDGIVAHSFTRGRLPGSALTICLIATKYFSTTKILMVNTGLLRLLLGI